MPKKAVPWVDPVSLTYEKKCCLHTAYVDGRACNPTGAD